MVQRFPVEHEERLWDVVEAAWAPLGVEVDQARRALTHGTPGPGEDLHGKPPLAVVEAALKEFLSNLGSIGEGLSADELTDLDRVVEAKLYDIDRADVQAVTDGSDDGFLYARGFIVAMGRDFYAAVAEDPKKAVPDAECEGMCYFFAHLHNKRYGDFPDTGSGISRESCSNPAGWPS
ncbi:DUF4240 domain-containing protein [Streptosporangium lutulentum]|uniref:DUF4240 domain-containing protein n=1 Tax=Streptosporangium lutulentum TaxID=1461250 RepID=A0ABT9QK34_9ACTN|nr:DUF4240 domain-containing protein [Streptosporangium lutulentum]MDP9847118.1 hypothetical protein [Streptosporangium lutulentum]